MRLFIAIRDLRECVPRFRYIRVLFLFFCRSSFSTNCRCRNFNMLRSYGKVRRTDENGIKQKSFEIATSENQYSFAFHSQNVSTKRKKEKKKNEYKWSWSSNVVQADTRNSLVRNCHLRQCKRSLTWTNEWFFTHRFVHENSLLSGFFFSHFGASCSIWQLTSFCSVIH